MVPLGSRTACSARHGAGAAGAALALPHIQVLPALTRGALVRVLEGVLEAESLMAVVYFASSSRPPCAPSSTPWSPGPNARAHGALASPQQRRARRARRARGQPVLRAPEPAEGPLTRDNRVKGALLEPARRQPAGPYLQRLLSRPHVPATVQNP